MGGIGKTSRYYIELPYDPAISLPDIIPWENPNSKGHMYSGVQRSTIHSSQDLETTWMFNNRWTEVVVHIYDGILLSH